MKAEVADPELNTSPSGGSAISKQSISVKVNGQDIHADIDPAMTLLDFLREHLRYTGTKKGCDHGQCGACEELQPLQEAFIRCDAFQYGYRPPGQICPAAISNAVYHATGKRIRSLPITLDKVICS